MLTRPQTTEQEQMVVANHYPATQPVVASPKTNFRLVILALSLLTLAFRVFLLNQQSAYMDEGTFVLTGRTLLEKHTSYAGALEWTYGSYLWSLVAGVADMVGGLVMVRLCTVFFGLVMVLSTALIAAKLAPASYSPKLKLYVMVVAGLIMALFPTALGLSRFGTYDGMAGAALMSGFYLIMPVEPPRRRSQLLLAALLFFAAFLAKYVVAIYLPFVCLLLLFSSRRLNHFILKLVWFVLPLSVACLIYFVAFHSELLTLLAFSTTYSDLKSSIPWREYILQRPELWVLAGFAVFGWRRATDTGRLVGGIGLAIIVGFQLFARPDFDFWKHSIYVIFFLAPLAALVIAPWLQQVLKGAEEGNFISFGKMGLTTIVLLILTGLSIGVSNELVTFYPNLNPSLDAIQKNTAQAHNVLVDDSVVRYYLYPRIPTDRVTDPFFINYNGLHGKEAYQAAITDRYYDTIVLDGGIGPLGQAIKKELKPLINRYYQPVYTSKVSGVEIYQPRVSEDNTTSSTGTTFYFDSGLQDWTGHPESTEPKPGLQVEISKEQSYQNHPSLKFTPTLDIAAVSLRQSGQLKKMTAQIYVVDKPGGAGFVSVGMFIFDDKWQWHDNGFKQTAQTGRWVEVSWEVPASLAYNEVGFKFVGGSSLVYIGKVTIEP